MPDNASGSVSQRSRATVVIGDYELGAQIGRGSFATVYRGVNKRTGALVAVKSVVRSSLTRRLLENLETEINILRTVRHTSIVELLDCLKSRNHIHLVMEYCTLGDLAAYMRQRKQHTSLRNSFNGLNMHIARSFVYQLGTAMRFLRARDIIHRDIKTQNILLQPPCDDYVLGESEARGVVPWIKVADFGFARNLPSSALAETLCGSPLYMAPEILHYEPYDAKADLWSIGAVTFEIMTGKPPFHASNHVELARVIERTNDNIVFPDERRAGDGDAQGLDPVLKDLVRRLLKMKPNDRMSFEDFFAHPALDQQHVEAMSPRILSADTQVTERVAAESPRAEAVYSHHRQFVQQTARGLAADIHGNAAGVASPPDTRQLTAAMDRVALGDVTHPLYPPSPLVQRQPRVGGHFESDADQHVSNHFTSDVESRNERRSSLAEEQAMAEREYVVIEKRAVEMNVLADEFESSPRTPIAFYPPRPGAIQQAPGVARQMSALARAVHNAVSPQYNISTEAANGPINTQAGVDGASRRVATGRTIHGVFNPLDAVLAETFESRHSQGTAQEDPTIRRMEGLAYKALAMIYLADMKWRLLPRAPPVTDPLANPENGFLDPSDLTIEEAFVLYLRALSLLHRAMVDASRHWASLHPDDMSDGSGTQSTGTSLKKSVTVSAAFNGAVQWVRSKFNECLERAEMLKQLANGHELDNVGQVSVVQVLYEQALAISKVAAQRELRWIDPLDCDRAYQLAIWMLSAILESDSDSSPYVSRQTELRNDAGADQEVGPHDRTIVERFIASIVKRREALQRRLMQQQPVDV
ncbi:Serine/threonine-protein kinase [Coemansia sp. RSA 353]|nr:Serine/threonine-protein kinase [Coemansia sp. RSA 788]KAJ2144542.1 Serine/threonine-protein kinase [Coemansia sp. RSA 564]KAJ2167587.1 Serine/threonine-protein kinase [Coemansia sp. RSA 562]KAJ2175656.1 Serine/threonine-protein kinase [Coemansia sp. RSA 560]KAJ2181574.1 Serine/threonine-protein kinase [Coemansia sp. RSA 551]KAJ2190666.1 Serine/threonine-protein kinase [Coemansia sp. RSA 532]KAJ2198794.1 Serine/threonine-protein kinase [Coemansia sp. RSA 530]KAJ2200292.1 Serine/threonine-